MAQPSARPMRASPTLTGLLTGQYGDVLDRVSTRSIRRTGKPEMIATMRRCMISSHRATRISSWKSQDREERSPSTDTAISCRAIIEANSAME